MDKKIRAILINIGFELTKNSFFYNLGNHKFDLLYNDYIYEFYYFKITSIGEKTYYCTKKEDGSKEQIIDTPDVKLVIKLLKEEFKTFFRKDKIRKIVSHD